MHGWLCWCSLQNKEKRKPKDERELMAKLRIFTRFQTQEEHEQLMQVGRQAGDHWVVTCGGGG